MLRSLFHQLPIGLVSVEVRKPARAWAHFQFLRHTSCRVVSCVCHCITIAVAENRSALFLVCAMCQIE